jgi:hypothetical protein
MKMMRAAFVLLVAAAFGTIEACPSAAETYRPWCVQYYGNSGDSGTTCAFVSYEQCMLTARGAGAYCVQNPWYLQYGPKGSQSTGQSERPKR